MKIGILTFTNTSNYGAALQAYALQQAIMDKGSECEIISYDCAEVSKGHEPKAASKRRGLKKIITPLLYYVYNERMKLFKLFEKEYCIMSNPCDRFSVDEVTTMYDRIIVGSDQVWNTSITGDDYSYFLPFIQDKQRKCSYAASVGGVYFSDYDKGVCEAYLQDFTVISTREETTAMQLKEHLSRGDVVCDIDPTLLLGAESWKKFLRGNPFQREYVFAYFIPNDKKMLAAIRQFAESKNCTVVLLKKGLKNRNELGFKVINIASPIDFLNLIYHSKYVVTGSFHALCFSLLFHKEFYTTPSIQKDRSGRILNMLETVRLMRRDLINSNYQFDKLDIKFGEVDRILKTRREASLKTIERILYS